MFLSYGSDTFCFSWTLPNLLKTQTFYTFLQHFSYVFYTHFNGCCVTRVTSFFCRNQVYCIVVLVHCYRERIGDALDSHKTQGCQRVVKTAVTRTAFPQNIGVQKISQKPVKLTKSWLTDLVGWTNLGSLFGGDETDEFSFTTRQLSGLPILMKRHRHSDNPVTTFGLSRWQPLVRVLLSGLLKKAPSLWQPWQPKCGQ